ncbi:hypothetical protein [Pseudoalteromonas sp. SA25]|uniref:hypothetical protein n=1 Tax=Pseudoalteromonas sp. SA25 TaxID=2686347 RepID=UPI0013FDAE70|nr:hypothetical protein [Pseudoalteromonas sp. SA25]
MISYSKYKLIYLCALTLTVNQTYAVENLNNSSNIEQITKQIELDWKNYYKPSKECRPKKLSNNKSFQLFVKCNEQKATQKDQFNKINKEVIEHLEYLRLVRKTELRQLSLEREAKEKALLKKAKEIAVLEDRAREVRRAKKANEMGLTYQKPLPSNNYISNSMAICKKEWTKRGQLDNRMYQHCLKGQLSGIDKVDELNKKYSEREFYFLIAYPYCIKKWTTRGVANPRMIAHCLNSEIEGKKDVDYYRDNYERAAIDKIVETALNKYQSWNMAAYSIKRRIK